MPSTPDILKDLMRIFQLHRKFNYHHADHCMGSHAGQHRHHPPFHPSQFPILRYIGEQEGCTQADIAQHLSIKPSTVAISVRRLEKAGHVQRRRDEADKRVWRVYLTEQAKAFKQRVQNHILEEMDAMLAGFDPGEIERLHAYLERIQNNLKQSVRAQEKRP